MFQCRLRINKDKMIRMSRWDTYPLSRDQKLYAAIDVYVRNMPLVLHCNILILVYLHLYRFRRLFTTILSTEREKSRHLMKRVCTIILYRLYKLYQIFANKDVTNIPLHLLNLNHSTNKASLNLNHHLMIMF